MKHLRYQEGGRPRLLDDPFLIQENYLKAIQALLKDRGAFVVQGCNVSGNNISEGVVFIDGMLRTFEGATGISFPCYIKSSSPEDSVPRTFLDGNSHNTVTSYMAEVVDSKPSGVESITFTNSGGRGFTDAIQDVDHLFINQTLYNRLSGNDPGARFVTPSQIYSWDNKQSALGSASLDTIGSMGGNPIRFWHQTIGSFIHFSLEFSWPENFRDDNTPLDSDNPTGVYLFTIPVRPKNATFLNVTDNGGGVTTLLILQDGKVYYYRDLHSGSYHDYGMVRHSGVIY